MGQSVYVEISQESVLLVGAGSDTAGNPPSSLGHVS